MWAVLQGCSAVGGGRELENPCWCGEEKEGLQSQRGGQAGILNPRESTHEDSHACVSAHEGHVYVNVCGGQMVAVLCLPPQSFSETEVRWFLPVVWTANSTDPSSLSFPLAGLTTAPGCSSWVWGLRSTCPKSHLPDLSKTEVLRKLLRCSGKEYSLSLQLFWKWARSSRENEQRCDIQSL